MIDAMVDFSIRSILDTGNYLGLRGGMEFVVISFVLYKYINNLNVLIDITVVKIKEIYRRNYYTRFTNQIFQ